MQQDDEFDVEALIPHAGGGNLGEQGREEDGEFAAGSSDDEQAPRRGRVVVSCSDPSVRYSGRAAGAVSSFICAIDEALGNQQEEALVQLYLRQYYNLSEKVFRAQLWPDVVEEPTGGEQQQQQQQSLNPLTLLLYHELRMRHLYSQKVPSLLQRIDSWECFMHLIDEVMDQAADIKVFPLQWAWDILDECLYQFQAFCFAVQHAVRQGKAEQFLTAPEPSSPDAPPPPLAERLPAYWSMEGVAEILDAFI